MKTLAFIASALTLATAAPSLAQTSGFIPITAASGDIRGAVRAIRQENWRVALHFAEAAMERRGPAFPRAAAAGNACIALSHLGRHEAAVSQCAAAVELEPEVSAHHSNLELARTRAQGATAS